MNGICCWFVDLNPENPTNLLTFVESRYCGNCGAFWFVKCKQEDLIYNNSENNIQQC